MDEEFVHGSYTLSDYMDLYENYPRELNKIGDDGMSPLMFHVYQGHYQVVSLLLQNEDININQRNIDGHSAYFFCLNPMEHVSEECKLKCLKLLIEAGVENLYRVHEGHNLTPLMIAASRCDDVCLAEIIEAGYSNVVYIIYSDDEDEVHDFDLDSEDEDLLESRDHFYDEFYDDDDEDMDIDIQKRMVDFHTYCHEYKKHWSKGIDFWDFRNRKTAFQLCLEARDIPVEKQLACLKLLVEAGASYVTDEDGYQLRPITIAIGMLYAVDPSVIKYLISIGCYLDKQEDFERAVCYMQLDIAQLLITEGSDPYVLDTNKRNLLHTFFMWDNLSYFEHDEVYEKMKKMLRFLVQELKLDINAVDGCGVSILSLVFLCFVKGITFPFLYLMSENINYNIMTSTRELKEYHAMFQTAKIFALGFKEVDHYKLLYDMGISLDLNCKLHDRFRGKNEPNEKTLKWLEEISSKPDSLFKSCKFTVRKLLGKDIKSKISQLDLPNVLKDLILLKDILPVECFEY